MKIFLLSLMALLVCATAHAQTTKGRMYLNGNLRYTTDTHRVLAGEPIVLPWPLPTYKITNTYFNIQPSWGYFVSDKVTLGAHLGYSLSQTKRQNEIQPFDKTVSKTNGFSYGIHSRYYAKSFTDNFKFFLSMSLSASTARTEGTTFRTSTLYAGISPNFSYFFNNKWCLELGFTGLQYSKSRIKNIENGYIEPTSKTSNFVFGVQSFSPNLGITYFIR
jgi:outer membrane protein